MAVAWLFACFCVSLLIRFQHTGGGGDAPEIIQVAERLAVVGRYASDLSPELREKLLSLAGEVEENPQAQSVISGELPSDTSQLTRVYELMARELEETDPPVRSELQQLAAEGQQRFAITGLLLGSLVLLALLSFLGPRTEESGPPRPTTLSSLGILGIFFLWDVLGFFGLGSLIGLVADSIDRFALVMVSQLLLYGLLVALLYQGGLNRDASFFGKFSASWLGKGYFAAVLIVLAVNLTSSALSGHSPQSENPVLRLFVDAPSWKIALLGLLVVFIGPFFEEIVFRGWLYGGLQKEWGDTPALLLSSGLFALIHGDAPGLPALFALGMVFGWVYRRSGSLWASILVHAFWNATTFALLISVMP